MMAPRLPSETPRTVKTLIILWTAGQTGAKVHSIMEFSSKAIKNFFFVKEKNPKHYLLPGPPSAKLADPSQTRQRNTAVATACYSS